MLFFVAFLGWSSPRSVALFTQLLASSAFDFAVTTVELGFTALNFGCHIYFATLIPFLAACHGIIAVHKDFLAT